jgi:glucose uptake protein GlcU
MSFAGKWLELKIIMLSKISQTQKYKCHMVSFICGLFWREGQESRTGTIRDVEG